MCTLSHMHSYIATPHIPTTLLLQCLHTESHKRIKLGLAGGLVFRWFSTVCGNL
jgi:hypothetical protein